MTDAPALNVQLVTRDQIARIDKGKDYGTVAGSLTLDGTVGTHILDASGALTVTLPTPVPDWSFLTLICMSGGANVTMTGVDAWPLGAPTSPPDALTYTFQRARGQWLGFAAGAGAAAAEPDTTPPSQPGLVATTVNDTSVILTVTRGEDDESKPTFQGRYYPANAAASAKPAFAPVALTNSGTTWEVDGLTQDTAYVFESQEVSKGGTSPITSLPVTTAKTHGWIVSSSALFDAPDGTDPATLTMSDGQAITRSAGNSPATISGNALMLSTAQAENGAVTFRMPTTSVLKLGRARGDYRFLPGSGVNTYLSLVIEGGYPLGSVALNLAADGSLRLDTGGSNATWTTPVWTGVQTGYPSSGTISLSVDADNKTVYVWANGQTVASATCSEAIPGMDAARVALALWGGGGIAVDQVDLMAYQN